MIYEVIIYEVYIFCRVYIFIYVVIVMVVRIRMENFFNVFIIGQNVFEVYGKRLFFEDGFDFWIELMVDE